VPDLRTVDRPDHTWHRCCDMWILSRRCGNRGAQKVLSPQGLLKRGSKMLCNTLKRIVFEDDGMEMVEWAIVGVVFAVAAAIFWTDLGTAVDGALGQIETSIAGAP
jgi:Flp pilus assembly pilin Flp